MSDSIIKRPFTYKFYNVTYILIGLNILLFFITSVSNQAWSALVLKSVHMQHPVYGTAFWQLITYMFVHANFSHILFNMLGLFFFGVQVERRMGSSEFLLFYLLTGFMAGLFSLLVFYLTGSVIILLGASGAVFAVLLAFATFFPDANIYIFGLIPVRAPLLVTGYAVIELLSQFLSVRSGVAHLTHLAGFGFAFLYFLIRFEINPIKVFIQSSRR